MSGLSKDEQIEFWKGHAETWHRRSEMWEKEVNLFIGFWKYLLECAENEWDDIPLTKWLDDKYGYYYHVLQPKASEESCQK